MPPEDIVRLRHMLEAINDASSSIFDVDTEIAWKTVTVELSALAAELRPLLRNDC